MGVWDFIRSHFLAMVFTVAILAALLYKPLTQSSPVEERSRFAGTVVAITNAGDYGNARAPLYGYRIQPMGGGQAISIRSPSRRRMGEEVMVERVTRRNGHVTHDIATFGSR